MFELKSLHDGPVPSLCVELCCFWSSSPHHPLGQSHIITLLFLPFHRLLSIPPSFIPWEVSIFHPSPLPPPSRFLLLSEVCFKKSRQRGQTLGEVFFFFFFCNILLLLFVMSSLCIVQELWIKNYGLDCLIWTNMDVGRLTQSAASLPFFNHSFYLSFLCRSVKSHFTFIMATTIENMLWHASPYGH